MSVSGSIYLDYQATTPCDARVLEAMLPFFTEEFGNPASLTHGFGQRAQQAVESARAAVATSIGASPREIVFTSGATESNNLALVGVARAYAGQGNHIVTCQTEHRAVLDPCLGLEAAGFRVTALPVGRDGLLDPDSVREALEPGTLLISVMQANNEIGVVQDLASIGKIARERGVLFHTDAAQSVGKIPVDVERLGVDLLSLTGHKLYGPKGIGALYLRRRRPAIRLEPILRGGGHEGGLRSGTLPVPLCVGLGRACELATDASEPIRLRALRERLLQRLTGDLDGVHLNGHAERRLPGNLNLSFLGIESEALLLALPELALSSGSACTSAKPEPSHVLSALGLSPARRAGSLRFGLGRWTTEAEIDAAAALVAGQVRRLRALAAGSR